jgi:hypothetical protein
MADRFRRLDRAGSSAVAYSLHALLAGRFGDGPCLLLGEAAHMMPLYPGMDSMTADPLPGVAGMATVITPPPGNLIATGIPGGVGAGRTPKSCLKPGQEIVTRIERIGELRSTWVREQPPGGL